MPNKFLGLTLALLLTAPLASASVAQFKTFDEKVEAADSILRGRAVATQSRFDESGRWIITETTFAVDEALKGEPGSTITIVTSGGRVGNLNQRTIGIPEFSPGDERILFTAKVQGADTVLYQNQGTYEIVRDSGGELVVPAASDLVLVDPQRGTVEVAEQPRSLERFRTDVNRALGPDRIGRIQTSEMAPPTEERRMPWIPLAIVAFSVIVGVVLVVRKFR